MKIPFHQRRAHDCRHLVLRSCALAVLFLGSGDAFAQPATTFARDVAPIVFERCASCHRPQGSAPFSLLTYDEIRSRAERIVQVTAARVMPPWKPEPGYGEFIGDRRLSDSQIATFQRWVRDGTPEGDPAEAPQPQPLLSGWQGGAPDLILTLPAYTLAAGASDVFRGFVVRVPDVGTRYVRRLEFRPASCCIHHANILVDESGTSRALDDADPLPGYEGLVPHTAAFPDGHFLGWTPAQTQPTSEGQAWRLAGGSDFLVQLHMMPGRQPERIQPLIGLYFTDGPPSRLPELVRLGRQDLDIPPGEPAYVSRDSYVTPVDIEALAVLPHAHFRAREVKAWATRPDGSRIWLLYIRDWDFNWQDHYRYLTPIPLPAGTTITAEYTYDNSAANPRNPDRPPVRVTWGNRSSDEMGDLWVQFLARDERDRERISRDVRRKLIADDIAGYETRVRNRPDLVALRNDLALLYLQNGQAERAVAQFASVVTLEPASASARFNVGTALEEAGRAAAAVAQYREAVRLDPNYVKAHERLGVGLLLMGQPADAIVHLRRAAGVTPARPDTLSNLGYALLTSGAVDEAIVWLRRAIDAAPDLPDARYNLANALAQAGKPLDAGAQFRESLRLRPRWLPALRDWSWMLATASSADVRDAAAALQLAEQAAILGAGRDASALDALGAALAAGGRFDEAQRAADDAARLVESAEPEYAARIRRRLELYRSRRPYVQPAQSIAKQ